MRGWAMLLIPPWLLCVINLTLTLVARLTHHGKLPAGDVLLSALLLNHALILLLLLELMRRDGCSRAR